MSSIATEESGRSQLSSSKVLSKSDVSLSLPPVDHPIHENEIDIDEILDVSRSVALIHTQFGAALSDIPDAVVKPQKLSVNSSNCDSRRSTVVDTENESAAGESSEGGLAKGDESKRDVKDARDEEVEAIANPVRTAQNNVVEVMSEIGSLYESLGKKLSKSCEKLTASYENVEAARVQVEKQLSDAKRAIRISSKRLEKSRRHAEYQILALTSKQAVLQNLESTYALHIAEPPKRMQKLLNSTKKQQRKIDRVRFEEQHQKEATHTACVEHKKRVEALQARQNTFQLDTVPNALKALRDRQREQTRMVLDFLTQFAESQEKLLVSTRDLSSRLQGSVERCSKKAAELAEDESIQPIVRVSLPASLPPITYDLSRTPQEVLDSTPQSIEWNDTIGLPRYYTRPPPVAAANGAADANGSGKPLSSRSAFFSPRSAPAGPPKKAAPRKAQSMRGRQSTAAAAGAADESTASADAPRPVRVRPSTAAADRARPSATSTARSSTVESGSSTERELARGGDSAGFPFAYEGKASPGAQEGKSGTVVEDGFERSDVETEGSLRQRAYTNASFVGGAYGTTLESLEEQPLSPGPGSPAVPGSLSLRGSPLVPGSLLGGAYDTRQ